MKTFDAQIKSIADTIVGIADPQIIILFGSHASGITNPHSDLDILVVADRQADKGWNRRKEIANILLNIPRPSVPVDLLLYTPEEIEQWKGTTNHVITEALSKGVVLYERS